MLKDGVALVTGASLGVGKGIAIALAAAGPDTAIDASNSGARGGDVIGKKTAFTQDVEELEIENDY